MKVTGLIILLLHLSLVSISQDRNFVGGVMLGVNGLEVGGDIEEKWGSGGWAAGVCVQRFVSKRIGLQMELKSILNKENYQ